MTAVKLLIFVVTSWLLTWFGVVSAQEVVTLSTRPGVMQTYFIDSIPKDLQVVVVLLPGSGGLVRIRREEDNKINFESDNFLVRSRHEFAKRGVVAVIVDAPSDQQSNWGMHDEFRMSTQHLTDISAVVADVHKRLTGLPIFLVGTSRGTISAAALGASLGSQVAGVVLSSTVFRQIRRSVESGPGLSRFDFSTIKTPLLFVHHVSDQCGSTPYGDAARLADKYPLISVSGGRAPESGPCDPFSAHGYFGKESETVEEIVNWMLKKPFREEVR